MAEKYPPHLVAALTRPRTSPSNPLPASSVSGVASSIQPNTLIAANTHLFLTAVVKESEWLSMRQNSLQCTGKNMRARNLELQQNPGSIIQNMVRGCAIMAHLCELIETPPAESEQESASSLLPATEEESSIGNGVTGHLT